MAAKAATFVGKIFKAFFVSLPSSSLVTHWQGKLQLTENAKREPVEPLRYAIGAA